MLQIWHKQKISLAHYPESELLNGIVMKLKNGGVRTWL